MKRFRAMCSARRFGAGRRASAATLGTLLMLLATGAPPPSPADANEPLTVFAAASLSEAFRELGEEFQRREGLAVRFNFAGSQQLVTQLEQGAGADVFASADLRWMRAIETRGLAQGKAQPFAGNVLVVLVPNSNPARIHAPLDLARAGVRLVLAAENVPAGAYSREALRRLAGEPGYPPDFARRVLANVVSHEDNVRGVVGKVQLGEADAGMCYRSDVSRVVAKHVRTIEIPGAANVRASYPIAILRDARHAEAARRFVALVMSADGQLILARHGFLPPESGAR